VKIPFDPESRFHNRVGALYNSCNRAQRKLSRRKESNMDELIRSIIEKTGISREAALQIIDEVVAFAKSKVPGPFQHFVDQIFEREE
jgi:hypothetical protein